MSLNKQTIRDIKPATADQSFVMAGTMCPDQNKEQQWQHEHLIVAEKLLAEVEMIQREIKQIRSDMMLLQAMETALDTVSQNFAEMQHQARTLKITPIGGPDSAEIMDHIRDLQTVLMLIEEDAEYNGIKLFEEGSIRLASCGDEEFFLRTSKLPVVDTTDLDSMLELLKQASNDINARYDNIGCLKHALFNMFNGLRAQLETLFDKRC